MLGRYNEAIGFFEKSEGITTDKALLKINIGMSYYGLNDMQNSIKCFEDANKSFSTEKGSNFISPKKIKSDFSSERVWIALMLGNSNNAIRNIKALSAHGNSIDLYNLRDWSVIVKRHPENQPGDFDIFLNLLNKNINDYDKDRIYELRQFISV